MIKRIIVIALFMLFTVSWIAYSSSKKASEDIIGFINSTYSLNIKDGKIAKILDDAIQNGATVKQIEIIVKSCYQYGRPFSEVYIYIDILDDLVRKGILSDNVINTILEGLAKGINQDNIVKMIKDEEDKWIFCSKVSGEIFGKEGFKKRRNYRASLEKTMLTLMDVGFSRNSINELAMAIKKNKRDYRYFNLILKIALEIKSMNWSDMTITMVLKTAIYNGVDSNRLMEYIDLISDKMDKGINENEIAGAIIKSMESGTRKSERIIRKKESSRKSSTPSDKSGKTSIQGGEHNENGTGGMNSHRK